MWDTYYQRGEKAVPYAKTVTITENKAVTDDSVRLYGELLDKAHRAHLKSFVIQNTPVEITVSVFNSYHDWNKHLQVYYLFNLNGEKIEGVVNFPHKYTVDKVDYTKDVVEKVIEEASKKIADTLKELCFREVLTKKSL
jgi:hypothetical protein